MNKQKAGSIGGKSKRIFTPEIYALNPKHCKRCGYELSYKQRTNEFCSLSCSASANNEKYPKRESIKSGKCATCFGKTNNIKIKYCSPECRLSYKSNKPFEQLSKRDKRLRIFEEQNNACLLCKNAMWMQVPIPLEIDHVDGNRKNDSRINLRAICPNCHALTPTYKTKNGRVIHSDKDIMKALKGSKSIYEAMIKIGMSPQRNSYRRIRLLMQSQNYIMETQ